jgi:hypothetical protein
MVDDKEDKCSKCGLPLTYSRMYGEAICYRCDIVSEEASDKLRKYDRGEDE